MEELFYKYGVDVYFCGHVHSYERDLPVYQGTPEPDYDLPLATTHLLIGGAGNDEMHGIKVGTGNEEMHGKYYTILLYSILCYTLRYFSTR